MLCCKNTLSPKFLVVFCSGVLCCAFGQLLGEEPLRCFCEVSSKHLKISDEKDPEKIMYKLPLVDLAFQLCEVIASCMIPIEILSLSDSVDAFDAVLRMSLVCLCARSFGNR